MPKPRRHRGAEVVEAALAAGAEMPGLRDVPTADLAKMRAKDKAALAVAEVRGLDLLVQHSEKILGAALEAPNLPPDAIGPPPEWVRELGQVEADRRFRIAMAAWQSSRNAPAFLSIAQDFLKADAKVKAGQRPAVQLNVAVMVMPERQEYEAINLDESED